MGREGMFSGTVSVIEQALHVRTRKHSVMVSNVANIDTPHYKAFDVVVKEEMEKLSGAALSPAFTKTHPAHLPLQEEAPAITPTLMPSHQTGLRGDDNTVDLDKTMAALSENTILYTALAQIIAKKFEGLQNVINEGK